MTTATDSECAPSLRSKPLAVSLLAGVLSACGGGGSAGVGASPSPSPGPSPAPAPLPAPSAKEASRFLSQATMGASQSTIDALVSDGYDTWLTNQMQIPVSDSHWDFLIAKGYADVSFKNNEQGFDRTIWRKLISAPDQVRQRVVLALSEIFVLGIGGTSTSFRQFACAHYVDVLEEHAFGNYRQLLEAITLSTAMGVYLSHRGNQKEDVATGRLPDENYAREVMQLFSIGLYHLNTDGSLKLQNGAPIETYELEDIQGLAKVFTGWDFDSVVTDTPYHHSRPMTLIASRHSSSEKRFLGTVIAAGTDGRSSLRLALDTLAAHPNVGPFIGAQLIQRLVTSNPSAAYVGRVAAVFNNNGAGVRGDLNAVVRAILLDAEARALPSNAVAGKLREPIVRLTQWARAFGVTSPVNQDWGLGNLSNAATALGQSPLRSGSVFNFFRPGYVPPNTMLASQKMVAPEFQITNETSVVGYLNYMQGRINSTTGDIVPDYTQELALIDQPAVLLDRLNLVLAAGSLSVATVASIVTAVSSIATTSDAGRKNRLYAAILLVMAAPEYVVQK
jgi:uncharacterized protein (DUF1800 family)